MCGLPNSGKSTWAKKYAQANGYQVFSGDDFLEDIVRYIPGNELFSYNECWQYAIDNEIDWWKVTLDNAKEALDNNKNIIVDGTHMSKKSRRKVCNILGQKSAHIVLVTRSFIDTSFQNRDGKHIPMSVIKSMSKSFTLPIDEVDKGIKFTSEYIFLK